MGYITQDYHPIFADLGINLYHGAIVILLIHSPSYNLISLQEMVHKTVDFLKVFNMNIIQLSVKRPETRI